MYYIYIYTYRYYRILLQYSVVVGWYAILELLWLLFLNYHNHSDKDDCSLWVSGITTILILPVQVPNAYFVVAVNKEQIMSKK